jgi:hypothetical protein
MWMAPFASNAGATASSTSFAIPLAAEPAFNYLALGEGETANCPGTAEEPEAAPGNVCVYTTGEEGIANLISELSFATKYGSEMFFASGPGGFAYGSWAVTAP